MNTLRTAPASPPEELAALNGVTPLTHLGVIRVAGEEAAKFIHGQLTQDFSLLGMDSARLAAFCSPKGRMQASFVGFKRSADEILLVCSKDILASTLKRLSMFVLRAKARLSDASSEYALYGLAGTSTQDMPSNADAVWSKHDMGVVSVIRLYPALGVSRQMWLAPADAAAPQGAPLALSMWLWSEVRSGVATVTGPVFEAFVPQMLNYESIGGVNFKKGCYPGQEVVARSQFRGTLKRRAYVMHSAAQMQAGDEVFSADSPEQPAATVVQAASAPHGGCDAIVSVQLSALQGSDLCLGESTGPVLEVLPLPYPLLEDI
jgi:folate-binding protein YgfZ